VCALLYRARFVILMHFPYTLNRDVYWTVHLVIAEE